MRSLRRRTIPAPDARAEAAETQWRREINKQPRGALPFIDDDYDLTGTSRDGQPPVAQCDSFAGFERRPTAKGVVRGDSLSRDFLVSYCEASGHSSPGQPLQWDLGGFDFRGANLWGTDFSRFNLANASFQGAMLCGSSFGRPQPRKRPPPRAEVEAGAPEPEPSAADLSGATFRDADLGAADLTGARGLVSDMLAGCRLSDAKLPDEVKRFDRLAHAEKGSSGIRTTFFALLIACLYCWITVAATRDADVITSFSSYSLPIANVTIFPAWFFLLAPALMLSMFIYMQINLQRLWEDFGKLPAVFPDGERLDEKAFPWLLNVMLRRHVYRLSLEPPLPMQWLQYVITLFLFWSVIPLTLIIFYLRYLRFETVAMTFAHIVFVAIGVFVAITSFCHATSTLYDGGENYRGQSRYASRISATDAGLAGALVATVLLIGLSEWVWRRHPVLPNDPFLVDVAGADVSIRPAGWKGAAARVGEQGAVKGAMLRGSFAHARGEGVFLVNSNLDGSDWSFARLDRADLRLASLRDVTMVGTSLRNAELRGAVLAGANLTGADLTGANLIGADLEGATLPPSLGRARLSGLESIAGACVTDPPEPSLPFALPPCG